MKYVFIVASVGGGAGSADGRGRARRREGGGEQLSRHSHPLEQGHG